MYEFKAFTQLNESQKESIKTFLKPFDLKLEADLDYTVVITDQDKLIGTASKARNILKCFAIDPHYQGEGLTNALVKKLEDRMFQEGLYHFFIFTKPSEKHKFITLGYQEIISTDAVSLLENGRVNIRAYLEDLKQKYQVSDQPKSAIVMNGNPFTLGHRYLIERAAKENEEVIVLVVSEDASTFPFSVRFDLITEGTKDLENVKVIPTGPYLVSQLSFPTYFLKAGTEATNVQAEVDCHIFGKYYKEIFNINKRYIGTEPYCEVTKAYNHMMKSILPRYGIEVDEYERYLTHGQVVSASKVREFLALERFDLVRELVPTVTYQYLTSMAAYPIIQKIKNQSSRH